MGGSPTVGQLHTGIPYPSIIDFLGVGNTIERYLWQRARPFIAQTTKNDLRGS